FHWAALRPPVGDGHGEPGGGLGEAISQAFGDVKRMRERFAEAAMRLSGAGWLWLVQRRDGRLAILAAPHSTTPLTGGDTARLPCCLWPHAYGRDHADPRDLYLAGFWQLVDWKIVAARMRRGPRRFPPRPRHRASAVRGAQRTQYRRHLFA